MLHPIPKEDIGEKKIEEIVGILFQEYPDIIKFLNGRISTIKEERALIEKKQQFIDVNHKIITGELDIKNQEEMIIAIQKEKDDFRNEVIKYIQIEKNKQHFTEKERSLISQEQTEAESLIIDL